MRMFYPLDFEYCMIYYIMTELLLQYDSRGKNMMFAGLEDMYGEVELVFNDAIPISPVEQTIFTSLKVNPSCIAISPVLELTINEFKVS